MSRESAISAIERGDLSELCHVLEESKWDIRSETLDSKGQSALHIACTSGHLHIVEYLVIEEECSVTVEDVYGQTPLLLSLMFKHWKIANFLLQNTPTSTLIEELHAVQRFAESTVAEEALHESLEEGHLALLGFLEALFPEVINYEVEMAQSKADLCRVTYLLKEIRCTIPDDMPDIHVACILGDVGWVKSLLDSNGQLILCKRDRYGTAAIHYAAYEPNILNMIIHKGGEVFILSDKRGNIVLHHCVMSGCTESVKQVIGVPECNVNEWNFEGDAPLHVACKLKNTAAVQLFVADERCDINIHNRKGDTALHIAAYIESNGIEMVNCLLNSDKCDLNQVNSEHETPLHVACWYGHVRVVEMLVADERCDPFIQDINGDTALYAAVSTETQKDMIVQFLLCSCRCDLTDKGVRCMNELTFFIDFVFSGITAMLEMSDYHVIIKGKKDKMLTLRKGASLNTLKMLLHHIANCNSLCSNSLLLQIPDPLLYEHTDAAYTSYITVNLRVQINTEQNQILLVEYRGVDESLHYNSDQETLLHAACRSGYSVMAAALLKYGADVQALDRDGNTAVHIACHNLKFKCLKIPGEYLNYLNADGDAAVHILCGMEISKEKLPEFVKFIRETKELDINKFNKKGETPLHIACTWSSGDVVQTLAAMECDVNACDGLGNTALHIAVSNGRDRLKKVQCLLESNKCNPNVRNRDGDAPLHAACRGKNIEVLEKLVTDQKCDVNIQDDNGNTPLHTAIYAWGGMQLKNVQMLLGCKRCDPNQQNVNGDTALHIVSRMTLRLDTKFKYLLLLLSTPGINPQVLNNEHLTPFEASDKDGNTLLHNACAEGKSVMVQLLIKNGADVLRPDRHGNAPIHIACINFRLEILTILLNCECCNPNLQNANGDTALHIVCRMTLCLVTKLQYLQLFLSTPGINLEVLNNEILTPFEATDKDGNTLLHNACAEGKSEMVQLLIENGADVLRPDRRGNAPIHIACINFRLETLTILLNYEHCNPNLQNANGDTVLHIVCRMTLSLETKLQCLKLLLSTPGINLEVLNNENFTPFEAIDKDGNTLLHHACAEGKSEMVQLLIENGADVLRPDTHRNAPIHIACINFRLETLTILLNCECYNSNQQNANGDTALHIVCKMALSLETKLQYLQLLLSTPGINLEVLNNEILTPFEATDKDGNTLLHNACAEGKSEMVQLLIENGADVLRPDRRGNAPIHIACINFRLETLTILLNYEHCNPNLQNANGDTALHIVCRMTLNLETKLQCLKLLLSTPGINLEVLNNENFTPTDKDGNTLLHDACAEGKSELLQLLIENGADVLRPDTHGNAPIHIACVNFRLETLKILLNCKHCDPNQQNEDGDTALHIVCRMRNGNELEYLKLLMSVPGINPDIANHVGLTLIEVAGTNYAIIEALKKFVKPKMSSIQAYLKLFVVGNSGAGKSTLIKAITTEASQLLKYSPFTRMKYVNPRDVPPRTAGIVPFPFNSKLFGNAVLYDFAGQHEYYSSHAAVMENLILPSPPLFLLLVDISKPMEEIKEELHYWWHFIDNQAQKATAPPHVLLGGSHKDIVKQQGRHQLHTIQKDIEDYIGDIHVSFMFAGFFPLDCRRLASQGLTELLTQLQATCKVLRESVDINLHCHILKAFLTAPVFQDKAYCKITDIINQIETSDSYLPHHSLDLIPLFKALNDQGHILLLKNHTDEDQSWVILKPEVLLTDVNGSIFAPENFQKRSIDFAMSTGVVTLSTLKEKFLKYNHEVIIAYLIHLEFCFRIKDQHTLDMITNNQVRRAQSTDDQEQYYFFPALVSVENPQHIYQQNDSITFECGWFYICGQKAEQLTTRFLHVLILRLAFACEPTDNPTEAESVVLLRRCSVWKHGIAWLNNDGIETIVEVGLQCRWVAVMMRCPDNGKVQCAELRSKVIKTVLKTRKDFCPAITMKEYLIDPSNLQYPFEGRKLTLYSMNEIAKVIVEGDDSMVMDTMGKDLISVPKLLPFEPYFGNDFLIEKFFVGDTSLALKPDDITHLEIQCRNMLTELKKAFKNDIRDFQRDCAGASECTEVESCNTLFHILQRRGFKTWKHFEEGFSRFSIFCGRNPMVRTARHIWLSTFILLCTCRILLEEYRSHTYPHQFL